MKIIFNDATELQVQQVYVSAGALRIKTVSATQEQLMKTFQDKMKTKKMIVVERGQTIAMYENYTQFEGITAYTAGILEPFLYKMDATPADEINVLKQENRELREHQEVTDTALQDLILTMMGGE